MTPKEHNRLVGIFLLAHCALQGLGMILISVIYGAMGIAMLISARKPEEQMVGGIFIGIIVFIVALAMIFLVPQAIGGWKLLKERDNARIWGIVGSIFAMLSFPVGTAAGIYGVWFLFSEEGKRYYLGGRTQNMFNPPPPTNLWQ